MKDADVNIGKTGAPGGRARAAGRTPLLPRQQPLGADAVRLVEAGAAVNTPY
jgi:hypothetical protein